MIFFSSNCLKKQVIGRIWSPGWCLPISALENLPQWLTTQGPCTSVLQEMQLHEGIGGHELCSNTGPLFLPFCLQDSKKGGKSMLCFSLVYCFIFHFHQKGGKSLHARRLPSVHNGIATLWRRKDSHKTCEIMSTPHKTKLSPASS